jgi:hypothetical protein
MKLRNNEAARENLQEQVSRNTENTSSGPVGKPEFLVISVDGS